MRGLAICFLLVFFGAAIVQWAQNVESVNLTLFAWVVEPPLYLVVVIGYLLGTLTGWGLQAS